VTRRLSRVAIAAAVVGLAGPSLALAWLLTFHHRPVLEGDVVPEPIVVPAASMAFLDEKRVQVRLTWTEGRFARSTGASGLTTAVTATPGQTLRTGDLVGSVDGVDVLALVGPAPFHRPLALGDKGADVELLEGLLMLLGYLDADHVVSGKASRSVSAAIGKLNTAAGSDRVRVSPRGGVVGPEFDPGLVLWVGETPFDVGAVLIEVGALWPGRGGAVLQGLSTLDAVTLATGDDANPTSDLQLTAGYVLVIDETAIPLDQEGAISREGRARVQELVDSGKTEFIASVRLETPINVVKVPPSAVVEGVERTCLYSTAADGSIEQTPIELVGSSYGTAMVVTSGAIQDVIANPGDVVEDPSCD